MVVKLITLIFNNGLFISSTARVTFNLNVDRAIVKLALITTKASLPRLTASVITTHGNDSTVTVKGIIKDGVFGVFFMLNVYTAVRPLAVNSVSCLSLKVVLMSVLLL